MKNVVVIGASNSKKSINKALALHAASLMTEVSINLLDLNDFELPLFGIDYEEEHGIPEAAKRFDQHLEKADGIIVSLAEHNGSYSAVFKNLIDWLSRIDIKVWKDKPMLLMATSPGQRGGATVLEAARNAFPWIGGNIQGTFSLPSFYDNFSNARIANTELEQALKETVGHFDKHLKDKG